MAGTHDDKGERRRTMSINLDGSERAWLLARAAERAAATGARPSMGDVVRELIHLARADDEHRKAA